MPLDRKVAQFNRRFANHLAGPIFRRLPGFAVVHHQGRRSGRRYATPVKFFRNGRDYVVTLPYGSRSDWVRNVLARGGCELEIRGKRRPMTNPTLFEDDGTTPVPTLARKFMRRIDATVFLRLREAATSTPQDVTLVEVSE